MEGIPWPGAGGPEHGDGAALADVLDPVLRAGARDDGVLAEAINQVAGTLAALGVRIVDANGAPAYGVTDERAVIGALASYAQALASAGFIREAVEAGLLIERIDEIARHPRPRPPLGWRFRPWWRGRGG